MVVFGIDNKHRFQGLKSESLKILEENKFLKLTPNMRICDLAQGYCCSFVPEIPHKVNGFVFLSGGGGCLGKTTLSLS